MWRHLVNMDKLFVTQPTGATQTIFSRGNSSEPWPTPVMIE